MDDQEHQSLRRYLREARIRRGLTQEELAGRAGLSVAAVRDLEQGRTGRPRARSLRALADELGLPQPDRARLDQLAEPARQEPAPGPVRLAILGPLQATRATAPVNVGVGRQRVVLARLALTPNRPVGRAELIGLLWGHEAPPSAANGVQAHVSRLRRLLEPKARPDGSAVLAGVPGGYVLRVDSEQLDLVAYRSRLAEARSSGLPPQRAFDLLTDALEMWRGDLAAEDVPELDGDPLITELTEERVELAIRLARLGEALRRQRQVLPLLRRLAERHPWNESLHARLIIALAASGQRAAALDAFDRIRRRLADELGVDPGAELAEARQAVLMGRWEAPERGTAEGQRAARPWQAPAPPPDFRGRVGDPWAQASMHQTLGQAHWAAGKHHLAAEEYRRGMRAARSSGWMVGEAYLSHNLGLVLAELGRLDEAQELYRRALRVEAGPESDHIRAMTLNDLGVLCYERGQLTEAVGHLRAALRMNERSVRRPSAAANRCNLGMVLRHLERFDDARVHLDAALAHYRRTGSIAGELSVLDEQSQLYRQLGEWVPAVDAAAGALRLACRQRNPRAQAATLNTLGLALLGSRAVSAAQARFDESRSLSREHGYRYFECQAGIGAAEAILLGGVPDEAYRAAADAMDIAARDAFRALHGDALLVQAKAAVAMGDLATAADRCGAADTILRATNLPGRIRDCDALRARIASLYPEPA